MLKMTMLIMYFVLGTLVAAAESSFVLAGVVVSNIKIQVKTLPSSSFIDFRSTHENLVIATVQELSNTDAKYDMTISSANKGEIAGRPYQLKYDGKIIDVSKGKNIRVYSRATGKEKKMGISFQGNENAVIADQSDTIKLTYTAR